MKKNNVLDLHGIKHDDAERLVENFVLLLNPPLDIITGNSQKMQQIVINVLITHNINYEKWDSGLIKVL